MDAKQPATQFQEEKEHGTLRWEPQVLERIMRFGFQNGVRTNNMNAYQRTVGKGFSSTAKNGEKEKGLQLNKIAAHSTMTRASNSELSNSKVRALASIGQSAN